jgi:hypothetical protein
MKNQSYVRKSAAGRLAAEYSIKVICKGKFQYLWWKEPNIYL